MTRYSYRNIGVDRDWKQRRDDREVYADGVRIGTARYSGGTDDSVGIFIDDRTQLGPPKFYPIGHAEIRRSLGPASDFHTIFGMADAMQIIREVQEGLDPNRPERLAQQRLELSPDVIAARLAKKRQEQSTGDSKRLI